MKLGLLVCDHVRESLQANHGDYPHMFATMFARLAGDADNNRIVAPSLEIFDVTRGHYPQDIDDCDGYVATGSKFSVYDDEPWIARLLSWIRDLHQARKPLVGVCFGHQLIAQALGGRVMQASQGWGVGVHIAEVISQQHWMRPYQSHLDLLVSHQDQVIDVPAGSEVLMGSGFCPTAMFQVGSHFLGIQGHPEFTRHYAGDLMACRRDVIPADCLVTAEQSLTRPVDDLVAAQWCLAFLQQAVGAVPVNQPSAGAGPDPAPGIG